MGLPGSASVLVDVPLALLLLIPLEVATTRRAHPAAFHQMDLFLLVACSREEVLSAISRDWLQGAPFQRYPWDAATEVVVLTQPVGVFQRTSFDPQRGGTIRHFTTVLLRFDPPLPYVPGVWNLFTGVPTLGTPPGLGPPLD